MRRKCDSEECFFDVIITGDSSGGNTTRAAVKDVDDLIQLLNSNQIRNVKMMLFAQQMGFVIVQQQSIVLVRIQLPHP